MFDNLREPSDSNPFDATAFYEDEDQFREQEAAKPAAPPRRKVKAKRAASNSSGRFLGMTPFQRFALALMLFITVCMLGAMLLLVTGKVALF